MILIEDILTIHSKSIADFGGSYGVRDQGLLESAIGRPFQTFEGEDLYLTVFEKAAALGESLIINHPFVDGNKRTGVLAMISMLINCNYRFTASAEDLYNFVISISTGSMPLNKIAEWLKDNTIESV